MIKLNCSQLIYNKLEDLKRILGNLKIRRVFLVTGRKSYEESKSKQRLDLLLKNFITTRFQVCQSNPRLENILKGAKIFGSFRPDLIMAIGGGSVQDTAKLLSIIPDQLETANEIIMGRIKPKPRSIAFVSIPTTSGSGSEATHFAVVYKDEIKYSVASEYLIPDYVILDPTLTWSMPPYITAVTGMDALSQAIESYWAVGATKESKLFAHEALSTILPVFPEVVMKPNPDSRYKMLMGAHLAGKAINISKTTAPHAMSYIISTLYNIPHGQAVALTLPYFFEYNLNTSGNYNRGINETIISDIRANLCKLFDCKDVSEGKRKLIRLIKNSGLKTNISELGDCDRRYFSKIIDGVNTERLINNPKTITKQNLNILLESIL